MKLILYILALVAIGGAAGLSKMNIDKHQEQLDLTKAKEAEVSRKKRDLVSKVTEFTDEASLSAEAKSQYNGLIADKDIREKDVRDNNKLSASLDEGLEELVVEKDKINAAMEALKKGFEGEDIQLDGVAEAVTNLEDEKKELFKNNTAIQEEVGIFDSAVKANQGVLADFRAAQEKRRKNLAANKVSSLITAVDNEWGFVVVKPHSDAIIKQESKLVVIRGNKHIGRLTINAIEDEGARVLANIDYKSIASGMRIRPGDRVILSKPITK